MATQEGLNRALAAWAGLSVSTGGLMWAFGRSHAQRSFGRQTLAWGLIDAAIVTTSAMLPDAEPRRLRRDLWANCVADAGYIGVGLRLRRHPERRGDGSAVVVQGLFLLGLDSHFAYHLEVPQQA